MRGSRIVALLVGLRCLVASFEISQVYYFTFCVNSQHGLFGWLFKFSVGSSSFLDYASVSSTRARCGPPSTFMAHSQYLDLLFKSYFEQQKMDKCSTVDCQLRRVCSFA